MKRLIMFVVVLQGAVLVFAQNPEAAIQEMTGTVELKTPGSAEWVSAKQGDRLEEATIISTGFKSTAILSVGNSTVVVRPLTRLSLEALINQDNTETINLELRTGRIQAEVNPPVGKKSDFTVRSPMATASVRGTRFSMDPVNLQVSEGNVSYVPSGSIQPVMVNAGQKSWVDNERGQAMHPMAAAETSRSLPPLPGRPPAAPGEIGVRPRDDTSSGNLTLEIILDSK